MKKNNKDLFPAEAFRQEMACVRMTQDAKLRALSRMKGERQMVRRTGYILVLALLMLMLTVGGTLALQNHGDADKQHDDMVVLSDTSIVIPAQNGADAAVFTLTDALYDGQHILIAYKLENGTQLKYDVAQEKLPTPMFALEELESGYDPALYYNLSERIGWQDAQNAVAYDWEQGAPRSADGLRMDRWYDAYHMAVGDMHYLWMKLSPVIVQEYVKGEWVIEPTEGDAQENIWLNKDEITLQLPLVLSETVLAIAPDGQEMWFDDLTGASFELPPITIARTDDIEKRTVAKGVIQLDERTYVLRGYGTCAPAVLRFDTLAYDGSNIDMEYYITGDVRMPVITEEDVADGNMYEADANSLQYILRGSMGDIDYRVYSHMLRLGETVGRGYRFDVDPEDLRDENGNQLSGYMDSDSMMGSVFNPVTNMPYGRSYHLKLRVGNEAKGSNYDLVDQQSLIDKESVTVYLPLTIRTVTYAEKEGVMYRDEQTNATDITLPITIARSESTVMDAPWNATYNFFEDGSIMMGVSVQREDTMGHINLVYADSPLTMPGLEEPIYIHCTDSPERVYNAKSDIPVVPLQETDDPYGYFAGAAEYLNAKIGVRSVLLRFISPGMPVLADGTELGKYLDVQRTFINAVHQLNWVYTWKENADLSLFDSMEKLEVNVPLMETKVYAMLDEQGNVLVGEEHTPIGPDCPALSVPLP